MVATASVSFSADITGAGCSVEAGTASCTGEEVGAGVVTTGVGTEAGVGTETDLRCLSLLGQARDQSRPCSFWMVTPIFSTLTPGGQAIAATTKAVHPTHQMVMDIG